VSAAPAGGEEDEDEDEDHNEDEDGTEAGKDAQPDGRKLGRLERESVDDALAGAAADHRSAASGKADRPDRRAQSGGVLAA
jgi:hypothetical protein